MSPVTIRVLLVTGLLAGSTAEVRRVDSPPATLRIEPGGCPSVRSRGLLGLGARSLTLAEMVRELERGCLALGDVRFDADQDTLFALSPTRLAMVARALGLARGAYRVSVPPEAAPGLPPDTLQARRRGTRVRDQLVYCGASAGRLLEEPAPPIAPAAVAPGAAVPMLVRVDDP